MRFGEVVVYDMWKQGNSILLVVDTKYIPGGLVLEYIGKQDFDGLKRRIKFGKKILVAISRDRQYITLREEATFSFCA